MLPYLLRRVDRIAHMSVLFHQGPIAIGNLKQLRSSTRLKEHRPPPTLANLFQR